MPVDHNAIGERGESIVVTRLTRLVRNGRPLFRPQFLGEKFPTIDLLVELVDAPTGLRPFFLAQVKATTLGYTRRERRLRIRVPETGMAGLVAYPAPTYVLGIDEPGELAYIAAAVAGGVRSLTSLPTTYSLSEEAILRELYDEVLGFWQANALTFAVSRFL